VKRAQGFCRKRRYFLKLDVDKFFDSVDHEVLKGLLRTRVKDPDLLWLADRFIDHPVPWAAPGKGLPIGNLTSQHFANFYLSGLDHFVKERLRIPAYLRYMDDMVLLADEKLALWRARDAVQAFLNEGLRLSLNDGATLLAPIGQGLPFLGFRVFPGVVRIDRRGWRRFRKKFLQRCKQLKQGVIDEEQWVCSATSMTGHLKQAQTRNLRAAFFMARPGAIEAPTA
jgi:hypothetical protein